MNMGNYAVEIQNIARILRSRNLCLDTSPLTSHLYNHGIYRVEKLKFGISDVPRNTMPKLIMLNVLLDIAFEDSDDDIPVSNFKYPLTTLNDGYLLLNSDTGNFVVHNLPLYIEDSDFRN